MTSQQRPSDGNPEWQAAFPEAAREFDRLYEPGLEDPAAFARAYGAWKERFPDAAASWGARTLAALRAQGYDI